MPDRRAVAAAFALIASTAVAQTSAPPVLDVPAKKIPVPQTASPEIQKLIALPYSGVWNVFPPTPEAWKQQIGAIEAAICPPTMSASATGVVSVPGVPSLGIPSAPTLEVYTTRRTPAAAMASAHGGVRP